MVICICIFLKPNQYHIIELLFSLQQNRVKRALLKVMTLPPEYHDHSLSQPPLPTTVSK